MVLETNVFCEEMYKRLVFKSHSERLADILNWAKAWQSKNLPTRLLENYSAAPARMRSPSWDIAN